MTMTQIVGSEIEIDYIVETNHGITTKEIDLIVEINYETTTEMTIGKKIIGRTKIGNIEVDRDYYGDTCDDRSIDIVEIPTKIVIETSTEMIALTVIEVGLEKNIAYINLEKIIVLMVTTQSVKDCTMSYNC